MVQMSCSLGLGLLLSRLYEEHFRCVYMKGSVAAFSPLSLHDLVLNLLNANFNRDHPNTYLRKLVLVIPPYCWK